MITIKNSSKGKRIVVKSKYRIYALLVLIMSSGFMGAMEEVIEISESEKKEWQGLCIYWVFSELLETKYDERLGIYRYINLPFEIVGSKNFIADELGKKLDSSESQASYFKKLAEHRNNLFIQLKKCEKEKDRGWLWRKNIKEVKASTLLSFIQSLEEPIKKHIEAQKRTEEIAWRKGEYKWIIPPTGYFPGFCRDKYKCLALDIEKEFTLAEHQGGDYGW